MQQVCSLSLVFLHAHLGLVSPVALARGYAMGYVHAGSSNFSRPAYSRHARSRFPEVSHYQVRNYVRSYASYLNINSNDNNTATAYNTRVERIEKRVDQAGRERGWRLWLRSFVPTGRHAYRATWWTEVRFLRHEPVGSLTRCHAGFRRRRHRKYNAPSMPSIPGLDAWARCFPGLVRHLRQYRRPEVYANQTVLIVGAFVSPPSEIVFSRLCADGWRLGEWV